MKSIWICIIATLFCACAATDGGTPGVTVDSRGNVRIGVEDVQGNGDPAVLDWSPEPVQRV